MRGFEALVHCGCLFGWGKDFRTSTEKDIAIHTISNQAAFTTFHSTSNYHRLVKDQVW